MLEPMWSDQDDAAARRAGWFLFYGCNGTRIRALKTPSMFQNDSAAVAAVAYRAILGDELAIRAFKFLVHDNELDEHPYLVGAPLAVVAGLPSSGEAGAVDDGLSFY